MFEINEMTLENTIGNMQGVQTVDVKVAEKFVKAEMQKRVSEPDFTRIYGNYGHIVAKTELSWAVDCTLYVNFNVYGSTKSNEGLDVTLFEMKCELNWGGTSRSPRDARESAKLYLEMCDIADRISTIMSRLTIVELK
jgi:hypothetical protein